MMHLTLNLTKKTNRSVIIMKETILSVKNLHVNFHTGDVKAIRDVNFDLKKGETLAIVGESGSGKSVTTRTLMGLSDKKTLR